MNASARIPVRCTRIAQMVDAPIRDQTILLRAARMLKGLHAEVSLLAWQRARDAGRTPANARAAQLLTGSEQHLRQALLEYASLPPSGLRELVSQALTELTDAVELLETPAAVDMAEVG